MAVCALAAVVVNTAICAGAYSRSTGGAEGGIGFVPLVGRDDVVAAQYPFGKGEIEPGTKVLLVGESRPFYVRSAYVYHTVFDRCPLGERLAVGEGAEAVMDWLRREGITHVYVNWDEVARLQGSYGFAGSVNRANFLHLEAAGLRPVGGPEEAAPASAGRSLYAVEVGAVSGIYQWHGAEIDGIFQAAFERAH